MDQSIAPLAELLAPFHGCFRAEAFVTFVAVTESWLVCTGPRTLSEVWQFSVLHRLRRYGAVYDFFCRASWDWDELGRVLLTPLILELVPSGFVWLAVDDTLCHKRGKKVAFGGIYLDPVLSSRTRKVFRYAVNYVVLALVVVPPSALTAPSPCPSSGAPSRRRAHPATRRRPSWQPSWRCWPHRPCPAAAYGS